MDNNISKSSDYNGKKRFAIISTVFVVLFFVIFFVFIFQIGDRKSDRKNQFTSPNGTNTIKIEYDFLSRPSVYFNGDKIWEYEGSGFTEEVIFDVTWISEDSFKIVYNDESHAGKYAEEYIVNIP